MSDLSKKYQEIMNEIDGRISDKEELTFVKSKLSEISVIFIDLIERMNGVIEGRINEMEQTQKQIESKISSIDENINIIKKDIYEEDSDTEIVCPYCNNEFYAEVSDEIESEIECPECHNIIELDMNSDDMENDFIDTHGCNGRCGGCGNCNPKKNNDDI